MEALITERFRIFKYNKKYKVMKRKKRLIEELKKEVLFFYDLEVTDEITGEFVDWYFHYKRNPIIETGEREDFMLFLEEKEIIKLK